MPIVVIGLLLTVVDWHWEMRWLELCSALCSVYRLRLLCSSHVSVVGGECCLLRWYLFFFSFFEDFLYSLSIGSNLHIHRFCPVYSISCGLWNYDGSMVVQVII